MKSLFHVEDKVAVVTGGSRGIGKMIAAGLIAYGAKVYIVSRNEENCRQTAEELMDAHGGEAVALGANLASMVGIMEFADRLAEHEDKIHVLVNNAGANWNAPLHDYPESGWDKVMALNVKTPFFLTQKLLPALRNAADPKDPARVINIGSVDGLRPSQYETYAYSASKSALHQLTKSLAKRLARDWINVNAIAPGPFESKMIAELLDKHREELLDQVPCGRIGSPEDMAGAAVYLASRAGAYVNGALLAVDGGMATLA